MANTSTSLCNYALSKLGGAQGQFRITLIDNPDEPSALLCLSLYDQVRREVLCRAWWAEATKFADLGAELSGIEKADWEYAFNLPGDYLGRCQQIDEDLYNTQKALGYKKQYDKAIMQGMLLTNYYSNSAGDSAYIRYIFDLSNVSKFSPLLYNAIATKLAAELSPGLLSDKGDARRHFLLREYEELVLVIAQGENAQQQGDDEDEGEYGAITCRTT